mmetsp:Transcript_37350/g.105377  ORF Transcript_37350/g.105377 Transcript_37350/m.105377 type:complete len:252 (-) Transcript_37350:639-1394(-)
MGLSEGLCTPLSSGKLSLLATATLASLYWRPGHAALGCHGGILSSCMEADPLCCQHISIAQGGLRLEDSREKEMTGGDHAGCWAGLNSGSVLGAPTSPLRVVRLVGIAPQASLYACHVVCTALGARPVPGTSIRKGPGPILILVMWFLCITSVAGRVASEVVEVTLLAPPVTGHNLPLILKGSAVLACAPASIFKAPWALLDLKGLVGITPEAESVAGKVVGPTLEAPPVPRPAVLPLVPQVRPVSICEAP